MKKTLRFIFIFSPLYLFCQKVTNDSIYNSLKKEAYELSDIYNQYHQLYFQPNKYFSYATLNKNVGLWSYYEKKKYDSLILKKLPDSIVLEKSSLKLEFKNHFYRLIDQNRDFEQYTFLVYNKNDNLISKVELDKNGKLIANMILINLQLRIIIMEMSSTCTNIVMSNMKKKKGFLLLIFYTKKQFYRMVPK